MRRTDNSSFKNYEFKIEQEQLEERPIECEASRYECIRTNE